MPEGFGLEDYSSLRPFLYHTLLRANLPAVQATRQLHPTAALLALAGQPRRDAAPRREQVCLRLPFGSVWIQDQLPFRVGNVDLEDGWTLDDLLADLDSRVFFWAGDARGPVSHGRRHFDRYDAEALLLRMPFRPLYDQAEPKPEFCRFNSGSPRCVGGRKSPRGPNTFVPYARATFPARDVVEVTFLRAVILPDGTQWSQRPEGPWRPLWPAREGEARGITTG